MHKKYRTIFLMLCLPFLALHSAEKKAAFHGIVIDLLSRKPVADVLIKQQNNQIRMTNEKGLFTISNLDPGFYTFEFIQIDYQPYVLSQFLISGTERHFQIIELIRAHEQGKVYYIGGVEVTAATEVFQKNLATTSIINANDIEHIQATNLGDVLDLLPGNEISLQPALTTVKRARIRDVRDNMRFNSYGTAIIIDDIPISNSANLQNAYSVANNNVATSGGTGLDLREIPADNLESVEVIRGIAPANYGDHLEGIVKVHSKILGQPFHRLKLKNNPDTKEVNLGGLFSALNGNISYNFNWAHSLKDIRRDYDNTDRLSLQLTQRHHFADNSILLENMFRFTKLFEDIDENPDDPNRLKTHNHGFRFVYGLKSKFQFSQSVTMNQKFYVNYRKVDAFKQNYNPAATRLISPMTTTGTDSAHLVTEPYLYQYFTKGEEISAGVDIDLQKRFFLSKLYHQLSVGLQIRYDDNYGTGKVFNIFKPPQIGDRPYSFSQAPGLINQSIYINNEINGHWGKDLAFNIGLRYDNYTNTKTTILKGINGKYLNPRINLAIYLTKYSTLRFGYGVSSKAPAIYYIFPDPAYFDLNDYSISEQNESTVISRNEIISTCKFSQDNFNLKGIKERKLELSFDHHGQYLSFSVTGFYNHQQGIPIDYDVPVLLHTYYRPNYPYTTGTTIQDSLIASYRRFENLGWNRQDGIELTIVTPEIDRIHTKLLLQTSYHHARFGNSGFIMGSAHDYIIPFYQSPTKWLQKLIMTLKINYYSRPLGSWLSFLVQYMPHYRSKFNSRGKGFAVAYYDLINDERQEIPSSEQVNPQYAYLRHSSSHSEFRLYKRPAKLLLNFRLTKSLFPGAELSLFVNNLLNDPAYYSSESNPKIKYAANPDLFWGIEFSTLINKWPHFFVEAPK